MNTCSVTASADQGARQTIRRIARVNPAARIVVTGCYATRRPDEVAGAARTSIAVVPNDDKPRLISLLVGRYRSDDRRALRRRRRELRRRHRAGRRRPDGVHAARADRLRRAVLLLHHPDDARRSREACRSTTSLREVERVAAAGFKEIALTGVHLGSYGRDLQPRVIVARAADVRCALHVGVDRPSEPDVLFRISSLEPMDCTPEIVDLVADHDCFAPHFHLPLQHASNRMLAAMRRPYTIEHYAALVDAIRDAHPARLDRIRHHRRLSRARPTTTSSELRAYLERRR